MTAAALSSAHPAGAPPRNLLSVLWLQASALFERLSRFPGDHVRRIPALEACVRAYVCGAANDRLVADSALRLRLTEAAHRLKQKLAATLAAARGLLRRAKPQPTSGRRRLHGPGFDPMPSTRAMGPYGDGGAEHPSVRPLTSRPSDSRPSDSRRPETTAPAAAPASPAAALLGRRAAAIGRVVNPEQRLAAIARVIADPEPAIRRAMRRIAARWEDPSMALPKPEPDPADDMEGEPAHVAHPRPQLAAADRPDIEFVSTHLLTPDGWVDITDTS